jgi:hypothetical protein
MKTNQPTKVPHPIHPTHFLLHALNFVLVFCAGVAADVAVVHHLAHQPQTVRWVGGEIQEGYVAPAPRLPGTNQLVEIGMTERGQCVWRTRP